MIKDFLLLYVNYILTITIKNSVDQWLSISCVVLKHPKVKNLEAKSYKVKSPTQYFNLMWLNLEV